MDSCGQRYHVLRGLDLPTSRVEEAGCGRSHLSIAGLASGQYPRPCSLGAAAMRPLSTSMLQQLDTIYLILSSSYFCDTCKGVEWHAKRCYVGLVAVGFQEQAEDILVPPLLRNCLTLMTFPFVIIISPPPQNSGPCNSFYCLGHSIMSMLMTMMMMTLNSL